MMSRIRVDITSQYNNKYKLQRARTPRSQAPIASIPGMNPSFKLLSSFRISSIEDACEMAALTLSASSLDIKRPALADGGAGRGSSFETICFGA